MLRKTSIHTYPYKSYLLIIDMEFIGAHAQEYVLYCEEKSIMQVSRKTLKMPNILYPGFTCEF